MSTAAWLVVAAVGFVSVCLDGGQLDLCLSWGARRRALLASQRNFFARRDEYRVVMRVLGAGGFVLGLAPWLIQWQSSAAPHRQILLGSLIIVLVVWAFAELAVPTLPEMIGAPVLAGCLLLLEGFRRLLYVPFVWPALLRRKGALAGAAPGAGPEKSRLEEEMLHLILRRLDADGSTGAPAGSGHRMILGILDLDKTLVRQVMTPRVDVDAVADTATVEEAKAKIVTTGHSRLPVYHQSIDHIVGVVHAKDLLDAGRAAAGSLPANLVRRPVLIPESKNVAALLAEFQQKHNHFAVVLDEYGGTAGIVTIEDLIEEIIGEIRDEYDLDEGGPDIRRVAEGVVTADGRVPVTALVEKLGIRLPAEQDYDTVGGFVTTLLGRIPAKGETLETPELTCEILEADPRRVVKVRITKKLRVITDDE